MYGFFRSLHHHKCCPYPCQPCTHARVDSLASCCSNRQEMEAIEKRLLVPEIKYFRQLASAQAAKSRKRTGSKRKLQSLVQPVHRTSVSQHPLTAMHNWGKELSRHMQSPPSSSATDEQWHCNRAFVQIEAAIAIELVLYQNAETELMRLLFSGCRFDYKYDSTYVRGDMLLVLISLKSVLK